MRSISFYLKLNGDKTWYELLLGGEKIFFFHFLLRLFRPVCVCVGWAAVHVRTCTRAETSKRHPKLYAQTI